MFGLGVEGMTDDMEDLLSLGLKFVPVQRVNKSKVETDVERLKVRLMWDVYWKWIKDFKTGEEREVENEEEEEETGEEIERREGQRRKERKFEGKTDRMPGSLPCRWKEAITKYCEAIKEDMFKGLKRNVKDNLAPKARLALEGLQEKVRKKEWAVRPADKGGGITVEPYEHIRQDGKRELGDETTFARVEKPGTSRTIREVETKLKEMRDNGYITTKMRDFLSAKNTKGGIMKINRKVHKKINKEGRYPTRVYISGIGTPTEGIAGLVEEELREGVEAQESYVQDTADFLRRVEEMGGLDEDDFMFTMDIVALYPSVPQGKARQAMQESLERRNEKKIPTEDLLELSELVLKSNEFQFEGENFIQKEGTAIGSRMGKNYACTYMGKWEKEVCDEARRRMGKGPKWWKRFVDDIFGVWQGTKEEFLEFIKICNENEERIKVTYEICEKEAVFLDVKVVRIEEGRVKTELYVKPTDRTRYLHVNSDHPRHVKEGIAKGQARRLRRICSEEQDYWKHAEKTKEKMISRGYGDQQVGRQLRDAFKMSRRDALQRVERRKDSKINFVTTHSAYLPNVNRILKRHRHYLNEDGLEGYINEVPRLSLRRGKNLADLVVNAKVKKVEGRSGPCGRKCKLCSFMEETSEVTDKEGKKMKIVGEMDCRTVGGIYGMWCRKCEKVVYVGKTMNRIMDRFTSHRSDLRGEDESKPAFHFKREGHVEDDMRVVVLEEVAGRDDMYRVTRERWWINRMGTFQEENKRK